MQTFDAMFRKDKTKDILEVKLEKHKKIIWGKYKLTKWKFLMINLTEQSDNIFIRIKIILNILVRKCDKRKQKWKHYKIRRENNK